MTVLPIGQYFSHNNAEYVICAVTSDDKKISYTLLGLNQTILIELPDTYLCLYTQIDKVMPSADVFARYEVVQSVIQHSEQAALSHREEIEELLAMPFCSRCQTLLDVQNLALFAEKNIHILLKKHFKGVNFLVDNRRDSEINCNYIDVEWQDGPTKASVESVIGCFQKGNFDNTQDTNKDDCISFNILYGGVEQLYCARLDSDDLIAEAIETLRNEYGEDTIKPAYTVEAFQNGELVLECLDQFPFGLQDKISSVAGGIDKYTG